MKQTNKKSIIETVVQTVSGLLLSFLIQIVIYPVMDIPVKLYKNVIITAVFFIASLGRGYLIRRLFNRS